MRQVISGTDRVYGWRRNTKSRPLSAPTFCSPRRWPSVRETTWRYDPLVYAARGADHGDVDKRRIARSIRSRNPYPGKLGVVEEGALADLLLVDGNPLENIELVKDPARNFLIIMKDGKIYKNLVVSDK